MGRTLRPTDRSPLRQRIVLMALGALLWAGGVEARLVYLQVHQAEAMRDQARSQQQQVQRLAARRGMLYDRNGRELAMSIEVDSVYAVPAKIRNPARTAAALAAILEPDPRRRPGREAALHERLNAPKSFVFIERKVDPAIRARIEALGLEGVGFEREHKRFYPHGSLAAHVLGIVGMDNNGMEGIEHALDARIHGRDGRLFALVDARRKHFLQRVQSEMQPGNSAVLTIDTTIQHIAERELAAAMRTSGARWGSVVVMEPSTGDILAMANEPTFNPNRFGDVPREVRINRAVEAAYEPGSTFKVITMAAALERGLVEPHEVIDCGNGSIRVRGITIRDHKRFDRLSATEVLEQSSNIGAIRIGLRLTSDELYETIRRFGIGRRTGVALPGEAYGVLRDPSAWSGVSQASLSFGQEVAVTPLQMLTAIAAVGNGGVLQPPRILLRELDPEGRVVEEFPPAEGSTILGPSTVRSLLRMMRLVVEEGTAKGARMSGYSAAGKTGTAEKIGPDGTYAANRYIATFAGFTPADHPELAILVLLDEPKGSLYHGGDVAAPVFRRIAYPALQSLGVPPDLADGAVTRADAPRPKGPESVVRASWTSLRAGWDARADEKEKAQESSFRTEPLPAASAVVSGDTVMIPDLRGHSLRRGIAYLGRLGLTAHVAADAPGGGERFGPGGMALIADHAPVAGTLLHHGDPVLLRPGKPAAPEPEEERGTAGRSAAR